MGFRSFLESSERLLKTSTKPGWEEFWLSCRICILGVSLIGIIGFIVRLMGALLGLGAG
ncbi:MAG: protein translocase SEC61 complex subunit gamma [Candidatus Bathyarchaeia archaeon]